MRGPLFRTLALAALGAALPFIGSASVAGQASKNRPVIAGCPSVSAKFHPCALAKAKEFSPPRLPDGTPNLQGIWQVENSAAVDLLDHGATLRGTRDRDAAAAAELEQSFLA